MLDLRGNGGGLLTEAVLVASQFIEDGEIVTTEGRTKPERVFEAQGDAIDEDIPVVVLVDGGSASASEIVTGALRDTERAIVVGERTFGKGVFQEVQPLSNGGALDLTVGSYFLPDGDNISGPRDRARREGRRQAEHRARRGAPRRARSARRRGEVSAVSPPAARGGAASVRDRPGAGRRAMPDSRVALLAKRGRFVVAEPVFERGRRITLDSRALGGARVGDLALLGAGKRGVRVIRSLGRPHVARDVLEALMLDRGLRRSFPRAVEGEAVDRAEEGLRAAGSSAAAERDGAPRRDLTDLPTFTIDPVDARDFDDAISARDEGDGAIRVWVHIADVSAYVRPGQPLEQETYRRATSVYVPGAVEPMLPEALSNKACSLVPGAARLAVSVEMEMHGPEVRSVRFDRSVVRSDARLDYDRVDRVFSGEERAAEPWAAPLEAARRLRRR